MLLLMINTAVLLVPSASTNTTNITLRSLTPVEPSSTIPPNFVGLSMEVTGTEGLLKPPTAKLLQNLFSLTGPAPHAGPNVRVGGDGPKTDNPPGRIMNGIRGEEAVRELLDTPR